MKEFIKEWGVFILILSLFLLSRIFLWQFVKVDGHSMDPTLADKEQLVVLKQTKINRFDIVVANEEEGGQKKKIVKRVIGMPGDVIKYKNDTLTINNKKTEEPYLKEYTKLFKKDKLQEKYSYNPLFQDLAQSSTAFTTDSNGSSEFTTVVPKGHYYLVGDDRIVSKDSRAVGSFKKSTIVGEVKFRFWPIRRFGTIN
ncbi:TPA: signal peptidase I [Streptococcus agalactiae]|nr:MULTISPECIES: signal peptidase I [Streptococcus]AMD32946.1 signal peptidase [Streptococcus agalactiae]AOF51678.1 signal peptidase [Streptococcus agalactiae]ARC25461.1 signal peptidase I [Streptococcus sp. 'group B']ASA94867.1 signal peptidase I [Streptococcus agalactiae]ASZ01996.1 signal peptidase I [Streptococcus agalactiae]